MLVFRVKTSTDIKKLSGAIFTNLKNSNELELSCLGAGSLNQAIKSVIIARGMATPIGMDFIIEPSFDMTEVDEQEKTIIKLLVKKVG